MKERKGNQGEGKDLGMRFGRIFGVEVGEEERPVPMRFDWSRPGSLSI